jgi:type II secretory pathway predicted ATPase ExeA
VATKESKPRAHELPKRPIVGRRLLLECGVPRKQFCEAVNARLSELEPPQYISYGAMQNLFLRGAWPAQRPAAGVVRAAIVETAASHGVPVEDFFAPDPYTLPDLAMPRNHGQKSVRIVRSHARPMPQEGEQRPMHISREELTEPELKVFGLKASPFDEVEDFGRIFRSQRISEALGTLERVLTQRGMAALIGPVGAGKSTVLRHLILRLRKDQRKLLIFPDCLNRDSLTGDGIVMEILYELGGGAKTPNSHVVRKRLMRQMLEQAVGEGRIPILVIDEAHDLPVGTLVALKRLWDSHALFKLLAILIVGQGQVVRAKGRQEHYGLSYTLHNHPDVREFTERCRIVDLGTLNGDLGRYIAWRFAEVEAEATKIITPEALKVIALRAKTPQTANNLCIKAMKAAAELGFGQVQPEHVPEA